MGVAILRCLSSVRSSGGLPDHFFSFPCMYRVYNTQVLELPCTLTCKNFSLRHHRVTVSPGNKISKATENAHVLKMAVSIPTAYGLRVSLAQPWSIDQSHREKKFAIVELGATLCPGAPADILLAPVVTSLTSLAKRSNSLVGVCTSQCSPTKRLRKSICLTRE